MDKKLMFFVDFDGTISREDVCYTMVKTFAREGWEEINQQWEEGSISTEECAQRTLALMKVEPRELEAFFKRAEIDDSFPAFVTWTKKQEYPLYILSDGYDNYIEQILTRQGLNLPYYANHLEYEQGWRIRCLDVATECRKCGVCKTELIEKLIPPGYVKVYIGDGYSDICAAENCDMVFAKDHLVHLCEEKGITFHHYNSFRDIQRIVEKML